jgi:hypothetical protein
MTAQLDPPQQLNVNDKLVSWDGTTTLIMQADGNLVLYREDNGVALWASNTWGKPVTHAIMQADGNFVCYGDNGVAYWATGTWGNPGSFIILQTDGNLVVYKENGSILWASTTVLFPTARLDAEQQLNRNDKLDAANGLTSLIMQDDGNLVLYRNFDGKPLWASNTYGKPVTHAIMQSDGNFVCYDDKGVAYWSAGTSGNLGAFLVLQDDGNLVINPIGTTTAPLWASQTTQDWDAADPGPPAVVVELTPASIIDVTDPTKLASFVTGVQAAVAPGAAQLQSVGLALAGPSLATAGTVLRIGLWVLSPHFPFAAPDPDGAQKLPLLTPACATTGFGHVPLIGPPPQTSLLGAAFALAIDISALNTIANAELPRIQLAAAKAGVSLESLTVTSSPPSPPGAVGGNVVTVITGSAGFPTGGISATITETLGLQKDSATGMMVPLVTGAVSTSTNVANQLMLASASLLFNDFVGTALFIEALRITFGAPPSIGGAAGPVVAQVGALVNMIPGELPFEPASATDVLPDFPKLIFNWTTFAATATSVIGRATVAVAGRPLGSGSVTLTGPTAMVGSQTDMAGGTAAEYAVTWSEIAPTSFNWQVEGPTGNASGPITAQVFPFQQSFTADFRLPDPIQPGRYHFGLKIAATEVDIKNQNQSLTAAAGLGFNVEVTKNPITSP